MQVSGSGRKSESRKTSSRDSLLGSCPVIDADFVEVDEDFSRDPIPLLNRTPNQLTPNCWKNSESTLKRGLRKKSPRYLKKFTKFWKAELLKVNSRRLPEKRNPY